MLLASEEPRPSYRKWLDQLGPLPWGPTGPDAEGVWRFDGRTFERIGPRERSEPRKLAGSSHPGFVATCQFLATRPGVHAIQAWAFPVRAKAVPEASSSRPKAQ